MKKTKWKLDDLPSATHPIRKKILNFTKEHNYEEKIKKGLPFFSESELSLIEEKYKKDGMTRKDIMSEAYKKGWLLKENTLKHYLQKGQLPRSVRRIKTDKGMISLYPATIIRHLNFIRYCLFSEDKTVDFLINFLKSISNDDKTSIEATSLEIDDSGMEGDDCFHSLWIAISRLETGVTWTEESIKKTFAIDEYKKKKYLTEFEKIKKIASQLEDEINKFEKLLKKNKTLIAADELDNFFSKFTGKN